MKVEGEPLEDSREKDEIVDHRCGTCSRHEVGEKFLTQSKDSGRWMNLSVYD